MRTVKGAAVISSHNSADCSAGILRTDAHQEAHMQHSLGENVVTGILFVGHIRNVYEPRVSHRFAEL